MSLFRRKSNSTKDSPSNLSIILKYATKNKFNILENESDMISIHKDSLYIVSQENVSIVVNKTSTYSEYCRVKTTEVVKAIKDKKKKLNKCFKFEQQSVYKLNTSLLYTYLLEHGFRYILFGLEYKSNNNIIIREADDIILIEDLVTGYNQKLDLISTIKAINTNVFNIQELIDSVLNQTSLKTYSRIPCVEYIEEQSINLVKDFVIWYTNLSLEKSKAIENIKSINIELINKLFENNGYLKQINSNYIIYSDNDFIIKISKEGMVIVNKETNLKYKFDARYIELYRGDKEKNL